MKILKKSLRLCLLVWLPVAAVAADVPWPPSLSLGNLGYWPLRVPVQIINDSAEPMAGEPVAVAIPVFSGTSAESIRVCRADGVELLFELRDARGRAKHTGRLAADDRLLVPAECAARSTATVYVYGGNDQAWAPVDFLPAGFVNGGFEVGDTLPEGWIPATADAQHLLTWEKAGGRNGGRCVKADAAADAPPTWFQWQQSPIPVVPGRQYTMRGWVRGENVTGSSGWYIHAYAERTEVLNQTLNAGSGTFAWKQNSTTITIPTNAHYAIIGTVLHGTGRAWFDDVEFAATDGKNTSRVAVGALERLQLRSGTVSKLKAGPDFVNRAEVVARNFDQQPASPALVRVNLRYAQARLPGLGTNPAVRVMAGDGQEVPAFRLGKSGDLLIPADLPPRSEQRFHVGFRPGAQVDPAAFTQDYQRLLESSANLMPNGSAEQDTPSPPSGERAGVRGPAATQMDPHIPDGFVKPKLAPASKIMVSTSTDAKFGQRSLELIVPPDAPLNWVGWTSRPIPVKPGATYLLSGWLKAVGLKGSAAIHVHFHDLKGGLCKSGAMASSNPGVSGNSDWVNSTGLLVAPPDAATLILHFTMNDAGTLRHDGIVLCEVMHGQIDRVLSAAGSAPPMRQPLQVWEVNPLIKVFPDTPPQPAPRGIQVELARNEFEPFQLALRGRFGASLPGVSVSVSLLINRAGASLPAVKVEKVGFVPVDYPSGYYTTDVPDWCRKVPRGGHLTDGWAGEWPDPLVPSATFDLATNRTQPVWFTVRAPKDATPGEYRGEIKIASQGGVSLTLPLTVNVLPFQLPDRTSLRAIFDFRRGPGGWYGPDGKSPGEREKWLRFMAEHRLGIDAIEPAPKFSYQNGKVTMDATEFDAAAKYCFDELGMNVAYTPHFFYMFGWAYPPKKFFGLEPLTPEWNSAFQQAYRLFTEHIRAKGWHDRFVYYISDEPHFNHDFVVEQMKKLCALIHEVDRDIPIYSSTWRHCAAWDDALDLWGVGQYGCFPVAEMERLKKAGKAMLFTCDGQQATDTAYLATERMLPYYCFKYGATGFEFWGLSWWTYDPWKIGWHWFIRQSDDGKRYYWIRYPNGDGYLAYPGQPIGVDDPVTTIRLEQVREGLEDYEAMAILSKLVEKAKQSGRPALSGERALSMAKDLVVIPNAGGPHSMDILPDPEQIPSIRKAVNAAIVELGK